MVCSRPLRHQLSLPHVPPASAQVLLHLVSAELERVLELLGLALETYIIDFSDTEEFKEENVYWAGWNHALEVLRRVRNTQQAYQPSAD
jgi:hypothetical protein